MSASRKKATAVLQRLSELYPDADCELTPRDPFELLVAVVLSAQTTDVAVNRVLPGLFARFATPQAFAQATPEQVAQCISSIGMYRQKSKNIVALSSAIVRDFDGRVPETLPELIQLAGVGRKTANVVMAVAFGKATGVVVDTHVQRLAQRLGWSESDKPEQIERDLCSLFERDDWIRLSHVLIFHGRRTCTARKPACHICSIADVCPSAGNAENVGRKTLSTRKQSEKSVGSKGAKATKAQPKPRAGKPVPTKSAPTKLATAKSAAGKPTAVNKRSPMR